MAVSGAFFKYSPSFGGRIGAAMKGLVKAWWFWLLEAQLSGRDSIVPAKLTPTISKN
jgi:hypothetical protein